MRLRLTPRSAPTTEALTALSALVRDGAMVLRDSLGATSSADRDQELERLRRICGEAIQARGQLVDLTRDAFFTPYDRGDIHLLAVSLTESLVHMERAVEAGIRHRLDEASEGTADLIDALVRTAEVTAQSMPLLRVLDEAVGAPEEIRRFTARAHRVRGDLLVTALAQGTEPLVALRTVAITDELTQAVRALDQVATVLESIVVKGT